MELRDSDQETARRKKRQLLFSSSQQQQQRGGSSGSEGENENYDKEMISFSSPAKLNQTAGASSGDIFAQQVAKRREKFQVADNDVKRLEERLDEKDSEIKNLELKIKLLTFWNDVVNKSINKLRARGEPVTAHFINDIKEKLMFEFNFSEKEAVHHIVVHFRDLNMMPQQIVLAQEMEARFSEGPKQIQKHIQRQLDDQAERIRQEKESRELQNMLERESSRLQKQDEANKQEIQQLRQTMEDNNREIRKLQQQVAVQQKQQQQRQAPPPREEEEEQFSAESEPSATWSPSPYQQQQRTPASANPKTPPSYLQQQQQQQSYAPSASFSSMNEQRSYDMSVRPKLEQRQRRREQQFWTGDGSSFSADQQQKKKETRKKRSQQQQKFDFSRDETGIPSTAEANEIIEQVKRNEKLFVFQ